MLPLLTNALSSLTLDRGKNVTKTEDANNSTFYMH